MVVDIFTTAPAVYDYHYATTLEEFDHPRLYGDRTDRWRKVRLDTDAWHIDYQTCRYGSGLHPVTHQDPREHKYPERFVVPS